jgi:hypothetical protein
MHLLSRWNIYCSFFDVDKYVNSLEINTFFCEWIGRTFYISIFDNFDRFCDTDYFSNWVSDCIRMHIIWRSIFRIHLFNSLKFVHRWRITNKNKDIIIFFHLFIYLWNNISFFLFVRFKKKRLLVNEVEIRRIIVNNGENCKLIQIINSLIISNHY